MYDILAQITITPFPSIGPVGADTRGGINKRGPIPSPFLGTLAIQLGEDGEPQERERAMESACANCVFVCVCVCVGRSFVCLHLLACFTVSVSVCICHYLSVRPSADVLDSCQRNKFD